MGAVSLSVVTDVSKEEDCRRMVEATVEKFGTIHILINNAGISMRALFEEVEISVLKRLMDVNFWGTVYCTRYALPYIVANKGSVVGVSSTAGYHGLPGRTGYSASKFAIHGFLETLRIEYMTQKLHVMIIMPGFTASDIRRHALVADGSEQGVSPREEKKDDVSRICSTLGTQRHQKKEKKQDHDRVGQTHCLAAEDIPQNG